MKRKFAAAVMSLLTAVAVSFTSLAAGIESADITDSVKPVKVVEVTEKASAETVPASSHKSTLLGSAQDADYFCITNVSGEEASVEWSLCSDNDGRGGAAPLKTPLSVINSIDLEYSSDKVNWAQYEDEITLEAGQSVYFRNDTGTFSVSVMDYCSVICDKAHTVSGDITTLLKYSGNVDCLQPDLTGRDPADESNYPPVFYNLFADDAELISAKDLLLPSMTLSENCYSGMFNGCIKLKDAPELPAETLTERCYDVMFAGCTALTEAPDLPAKTLAPYCYSEMFAECESLVSAPALPAETLATGCYKEMFRECIKLAAVPELAALKLVQECYNMIFSDCTMVDNVTMLAEDISAQDCMNGWIGDAAEEGTVIKAAGTDLEEEGYLPENWLTVGLSAEGSGKLTAKKEGTAVTLSTVPGSGYRLESITVKTDEGGEEVTVTDSQFTMPSESVTVTAVFAEAETLKVSVGLSADVNESTVTFTARFRNAEDGTYEMTEILDGKPAADARITIKNGTAVWTETGFSAGKHTVKITAAGASAQAAFEIKGKTDPKPVPAPVPVHNNADYVYVPLFTGTWGSPVSDGTWSKDTNGAWYYRTSEPFKNTWACIVNPYAGAGQNASDWFWFDANGRMLTGWQLIGGRWYYLNPDKDGSQGACLLGPGKTPDGYEIDASGAWTGR